MIDIDHFKLRLDLLIEEGKLCNLSIEDIRKACDNAAITLQGEIMTAELRQRENEFTDPTNQQRD